MRRLFFFLLTRKKIENSGMPRSYIIYLVFASALGIRLAFMLLVAPIDFAWDSYHRWQIAYYTLSIGIQNGRMWDLFGMEYFWGMLPELVEAFLLWLFNTSSILPFRIFNSILGSASVSLLYNISKRYYGDKVAFLSSALAAVCPPLVIWDTIALDGTLGVFFLLVSLHFYKDRQYLCGIALALASMCRVEFYFLSLGVCLCYLLFERSSTKFVPAILGWLTVMIPYLWFIQIGTGDWLYQIRWNYLASMGTWGYSPAWFEESLPWRTLWGAVLALTVGSLILLYRKRPSDYMVSVLFLGYLLFQGVVYTFSITRYILAVDMLSIMLGLQNIRFVPNFFFATLLISRLIYWPRIRLASQGLDASRAYKRKAVSAILILLFAAWLVADIPNSSMMSQDLKSSWWDSIDRSAIVNQYQGGRIIIDPGNPQIVYHLVQKGISYRNIVGSLYCPKGDRSQSLTWFKTENATWYIHIHGYSIFPELDEGKDNPPFYMAYREGAIYVYKVSMPS